MLVTLIFSLSFILLLMLMVAKEDARLYIEEACGFVETLTCDSVYSWKSNPKVEYNYEKLCISWIPEDGTCVHKSRRFNRILSTQR